MADYFPAAVIRVLLDGQSVNGHSDHLPPPYGAIAVQLKRCHGHRGMLKAAYDNSVNALGVEKAEEIRAAVDAVVMPVDLDALAEQQPKDPGPLSAWKFKTLKDAYQPRPPIVWAVKGIFSTPGLYIVYGAPGTLKSAVIADMIICVAMGKPWLTPAPGTSAAIFDVNPGSVFWLDFDNGRRRSDERFGAFGVGLEAPDDIPLNYISMPNPWLDASNRDEILAASALMKGARVIVIDNLGSVSGGKDENSTEMIGVMNNLRFLAEETGAAIIVIHHQRKGQAGATPGRKGDSLRGSSTIEAALDGAFMVDREHQSPQITITATKERGATIPAFGAVFAYEQDDNGELSSARFFGQNVIDAHSDDFIMTTIKDELAGVDGGKIAKGELKKIVWEALKEYGVGILKIDGLIETMITKNILTFEIGPKNAKIVSIRGGYDG